MRAQCVNLYGFILETQLETHVWVLSPKSKTQRNCVVVFSLISALRPFGKRLPLLYTVLTTHIYKEIA